MGSPIVEPVITEVQVPPGMLGPDPMTFEVRSFVVVGAGGVVLVDAGTPGSGEAIGSTLAALGATWTDVTDIVLTHAISTTPAAWPSLRNSRPRPMSGRAQRMFRRSRPSGAGPPDPLPRAIDLAI